MPGYRFRNRSSVYTHLMAFKIISLNLWHGGELLPAILDFLKTENADVVALQEVYGSDDKDLPAKFRSLEALAPLGYAHHDYAPAYLERRDEGLMPQGNAVISRFPIIGRSASFMYQPTRAEYVDEPDQYPILPRVLQTVRIETPDGELNVYNLHGVWDLDGANYSPARQKMTQVIIDEIKGRQNVILTGDSNATAGNPMMTEISRHLKNVFEPAPKSTFNMRQKTEPGYATAAVDIMFASSDFKVLACDCPDVDVSDHRPLVARIGYNLTDE